MRCSGLLWGWLISKTVRVRYQARKRTKINPVFNKIQPSCSRYCLDRQFFIQSQTNTGFPLTLRPQGSHLIHYLFVYFQARMIMMSHTSACGCYEDRMRPSIHLTPSTLSTNKCEHLVTKKGTGSISNKSLRDVFNLNLLSDWFSVWMWCDVWACIFVYAIVGRTEVNGRHLPLALSTLLFVTESLIVPRAHHFS